MNKQLRSVIMTVGSLFALLAITCSSAVAGSAPRGSALAGESGLRAAGVKAPASACATLKAGDVYWVTLDDSGAIDKAVDSYPDGTSKVTAAFDYNCIPKKTKLAIIWSIDGEQVLSDSDTPKATDKANTYSYSLYKKDDSALENGDYGVEFYVGDTLLATSKVTVGAITSTNVTTTTKTDQTTVTVQGVVSDSRSKKPINAAVVVVLKEGIDPSAWLKDGTDDDVLAFAKTDSKGQFELNEQVPTNVALPWIVGAKGYKTIVESEYTIEEGSDDPYIMDITLQRSK
ncbi:MAG: hypothetical protein M1434_07015 [Chloroflexi bacterium]|nr:hypothetical protein [Chloroflexota bacterium]MCL5274481.1 hypothetical protein [Chloroflexota bacterium]